MGEIGDSLAAARFDRDLAQRGDELEDEPDREQNQRRYLDERDEEDDEDQGQDPGPRI